MWPGIWGRDNIRCDGRRRYNSDIIDYYIVPSANFSLVKPVRFLFQTLRLLSAIEPFKQSAIEFFLHFLVEREFFSLGFDVM